MSALYLRDIPIQNFLTDDNFFFDAAGDACGGGFVIMGTTPPEEKITARVVPFILLPLSDMAGAAPSVKLLTYNLHAAACVP